MNERERMLEWIKTWKTVATPRVDQLGWRNERRVRDFSCLDCKYEWSGALDICPKCKSDDGVFVEVDND